MRLGWWMSTEMAIKLFLTASYRTLLIVVDIQLRRCRSKSGRSTAKALCVGRRRSGLFLDVEQFRSKMEIKLRPSSSSMPRTVLFLCTAHDKRLHCFFLRALEASPMEFNLVRFIFDSYLLMLLRQPEMLNNWTQFAWIFLEALRYRATKPVSM